MKQIILLIAILCLTTPAFSQERLPTNIFAIMHIKGVDWPTAQQGIARGESWRRQEWANRYLVIDKSHSWPYELTEADKQATDWYVMEVP